MSGVLRAFTFRRLLAKPLQVIRSSQKKPYYFLPPNQYDAPIPWYLNPLKASKVYLELIPILVQSAFSIGIAIAYIGYMLLYKMDVVYSTHNRDTKSRTMNLCHPVRYKLFNFGKTDIYQPWPEMQMIRDKIAEAERRLIRQSAMCPLEDPGRPCKKK